MDLNGIDFFYLLLAVLFFIGSCLNAVIIWNRSNESKSSLAVVIPRGIFFCGLFMGISMSLVLDYNSMNLQSRISGTGKAIRVILDILYDTTTVLGWMGFALFCFSNLKTAQSAVKLTLNPDSFENRLGVGMLYFVGIFNSSGCVITNIMRPTLNLSSWVCIFLITLGSSYVVIQVVMWYFFLQFRSHIQKMSAPPDQLPSPPRTAFADNGPNMADVSKALDRYFRLLLLISLCCWLAFAFQLVTMASYLADFSSFRYFESARDVFDIFPCIELVVLYVSVYFFWKRKTPTEAKSPASTVAREHRATSATSPYSPLSVASSQQSN
eukprot:TRINITY_DN9070_c0_g1_i4.p1 TRINITY_DN9070_c0_g1~~TRINITY_DN9070_c0_g1_i4.p1  ORF type:complete len:325 (-),score=17.83 TRINITY_DN9070_c0_g1_i4:283-1257(-)